MKRLLSLVLSGLLLTSCMCLPANALTEDTAEEDAFSQTEPSSDMVYGEFGYTIDQNTNTVTITKYYGVELEEVVVPSQIDSLPVKVIGEKVFYWQSDIKKVILPDSIEVIGDMAFYGCNSIESINFPESITYIGDLAFTECRKITKVNLSKNLDYLAPGAFGMCDSLSELSVDPENKNYVSENNVIYNPEKSILLECACAKSGDFVIPDTVTQVGDRAFLGCINITSVTMPDSVTYLGEDSFFKCNSLANVQFSKYLKEIGYRAFTMCESLSSISIPDSVEKLADNAFSHNYTLTGTINISKNLTSIGRCAFMNTSVTEFSVDPENPVYKSVDGCIYSKDMKTILVYPGAKTGIYVIPDSVERIEHNAFSGSLGIQGAVIPDSVTFVGDVAFGQCENLETIKFGKNAKYIGASSFANTKIRELELPEVLEEIGAFAFFKCTQLRETTIPRGVVNIPVDAFGDCENLEKVTIYETVRFIHPDAFAYCSRLTIYGYSGSYAEQFANSHNIRFEVIEDETNTDTEEPIDTDTNDQSDTDTQEPIDTDTNDQSDTDTEKPIDTDTNDEPNYGDVNGDGKVTAKDSLIIQRYVIKLEKLTNEQLKAADVDRDNKVTAKDALYILRSSINLDVLPIKR